VTLPDWRAENYFVEFDPIEYSGPVVDAPIEMKIGWIMKYLYNDIFPDAIKAVVNGGEIAGLLLGFAIVDYVTGYFVGRASTRRDFIAFLNRYFPPQYAANADSIYDNLRSGLVHNLTLQNPWKPSSASFTIERESQLHMQSTDGKVVFSIRHFLQDTDRAFFMFCHDLIMKPTENEALVANFHRRFNRKGGAASMMRKTD
jgi:hypothetical protein